MNVILKNVDMSEKFIGLLRNKETNKYNLKINIKYKNSMQAIFWNTVIRCYNKVEFLELEDDIIYKMEKIDGKDFNI